MPFSAAGIQTGTDTDLTGLTSITGVVSATDGNVTTYTFPSTITTALRIRGTLSHNTELERIIFQRPINAESNSPLIFIEGGTYNFGIEKSPGVFTDGVGIQINGGGSIWYNGGFNSGSTSVNGTMMAVGTSTTNPLTDVSTLNINGGRIAGQFHITMRPNGVINNTYNAKFLVDASSQTLGTEWLSRFYGGTFGTTAFAYEGGSISLGNGSHGRTLTFDRSAAGVGYWAQHANGTTFAANNAGTYPTIRNATFNGNAVDVAAWQSTTTNIGAVRIQNCGNGTNININGGETIGNNANNAGYIWVTKQVDTNFRALADQSNVVGTVRMFDTNRQADIEDPITSVATGAISYKGEANGSLTSWVASGTGAGVTSLNTEGDNEVALAFWSLDRDGNNHARGTQDTGDWAFDRRSNGGALGVDEFTFYTYAYGFSPIVTTQDLAGTGILTLNENFIADANITDADYATALAYTGIVTTNTSVVVSEDRSLDQLYDKAMADKVNNDALSTNAATTADWLFSTTSGSTLTLDGAKTISIGDDVLSAGTTHQTLASTAVVTIDGTGFNGIAFSGNTTGNFGAISNGANINTTETDAITVASINGSTFATDGALTISGASAGNSIEAASQITLDATVSTSTLETGLLNVELGDLGSTNTYTGVGGTGNLAISFTGLTDGNIYTPEQLLGEGFSVTGTGTITIQSTDADIIVETNRTDISAGGGVEFRIAPATIDFSGILAAESTFFSNAKVAWAPLLTLGNETLVTSSDLTSGIYTFPTLTENAQYVVAVSKPGRTNYRTTFTFTGGEVVTPLLMAIDAVTENIALVPDPNPDNLPTPAITNTRRAGGKSIYGLEHATTMNSMDGPQTVWVTELMKGTDMYVIDLVAGLNVNILHTSTVDSEWDGTVFVMEPIAANQQVTGINGGIGNPNPVQDNGTLSIFINGATEVNYGTIDTLFDSAVVPLVNDIATVDTNVDDTKKWVLEMRNNKLLGLKPQKADASNSTLTITDAEGNPVTP